MKNPLHTLTGSKEREADMANKQAFEINETLSSLKWSKSDTREGVEFTASYKGLSLRIIAVGGFLRGAVHHSTEDGGYETSIPQVNNGALNALASRLESIARSRYAAKPRTHQMVYGECL